MTYRSPVREDTGEWRGRTVEDHGPSDLKFDTGVPRDVDDQGFRSETYLLSSPNRKGLLY